MTTKIYKKNIAVFNPKLALDIYFVIEMDFDYDIDNNSDGHQEFDDNLDLFYFLKEANLCPTASPFEYWKSNSQFSSLKLLSRRYLSAPPSSVESERTFSHLAEIFSTKRTNLSEIHGKQQLFLHFNYDK